MSLNQPFVNESSEKAIWTKLTRIGTCLVFLLVIVSVFCLGRWSAANQFLQVHLSSHPPADSLWKPQLNPAYRGEPLAKNAVRNFDQFLMFKAAFVTPEEKLKTVEQWLAPDFLYETVGFGASKTPRGWCVEGEESQFRTTFNMSAFSQMLFFGTDSMATTTSYGNVFWAKDFKGIPATQAWTYFRVTDFYLARKTTPDAAQIYYNFMMIDWADLLRRVGYPIVPPAPLPEGLVLSAHTDDGVPAPLSVVASRRDPVAAKVVAEKALQEDWVGDGAEPQMWSTKLIFYGPGGIGEAEGRDQYQKMVLEPFRFAFAERKASTEIFDCEGNYCGAFGHLSGRHVGSWLGLEATKRTVSIRFAMHWRVVDGLIKEGWLIFDLPDLWEQLGRDFFAMAVQKASESSSVQKPVHL